MTREQQIRQAARKYFDDYLDGLKGEILTVEQTFEDAAKWADRTLIEKTCEWLGEKNKMYMYELEMILGRNFIEDFKKAMGK